MEKVFKFTAYFLGFLVVSMFVQNITNAKLEKLRDGQMLSSPDVVSIKTRERQLECLAMNIYREAGHENFEGKVAVAQVTMNRASHPAFPSDVCAVVYQKSVIMEKVVCQFSWACDGTPKVKPTNTVAYTESMAVAKKVLLEGFRLDVMKEALYYHANYVNPKWPLEKIGSIGNHIFYKGKKSNG